MLRFSKFSSSSIVIARRSLLTTPPLLLVSNFSSRSVLLSLASTSNNSSNSSSSRKKTTKASSAKISKSNATVKKQEASTSKRNIDDNNSTATTASTATANPFDTLYQRKTPIEHVLLRPDSYVGSTELQSLQTWVSSSSVKAAASLSALNDSSNSNSNSNSNLSASSIVLDTVQYVPALYKIFDEILVNALDNRQRDATTSRIDITVDVARNLISIYNNGNGIPIVRHSKEQLWIPELVMGHLLTGSNFDDTVGKVTGGRNGYGAKLANIFSTAFTVETLDSRRALRYEQTWTDNMKQAGEPRIEPASSSDGKSDYTRVTFAPDLARFADGKMRSLASTDLLRLMQKRAHDAAATLPDVEGL